MQGNSGSASFYLNSSDVSRCVGEVTRTLQHLASNNSEIWGDGGMGGRGIKDNLLRLKSILLKFEVYLLDVKSQCAKMSEREASYPGETIFDIYEEGCGINHSNADIFIAFVTKVSDFSLEFKGSTGTPKLDHFGEYCNIAFDFLNPFHANCHFLIFT